MRKFGGYYRTISTSFEGQEWKMFKITFLIQPFNGRALIWQRTKKGSWERLGSVRMMERSDRFIIFKDFINECLSKTKITERIETDLDAVIKIP